MPRWNRTGTFRAVITSVGDDAEKNAIILQLDAYQWYNPADGIWYDVRSENLSARHWVYLLKKDGNLNEIAVKQLRAALEWDGRDIAALFRPAEELPHIQVSVENEEYNGKTNAKVTWMRHFTDDPARELRIDPENVRRMASSINSRLKSVAAATAPAPPSASAPRGTMARAPQREPERGDAWEPPDDHPVNRPISDDDVPGAPPPAAPRSRSGSPGVQSDMPI